MAPSLRVDESADPGLQERVETFCFLWFWCLGWRDSHFLESYIWVEPSRKTSVAEDKADLKSYGDSYFESSDVTAE